MQHGGATHRSMDLDEGKLSSLQALQQERLSLMTAVRALHSKLECKRHEFHILEQDVLHHAARAEAIEKALCTSEEICGRYEMQSATRALKSLLNTTLTIKLFQALLRWHQCVTSHEPHKCDSKLEMAQLRYRNLLLQRSAEQIAVTSKREIAATIIWQHTRRLEAWLVARAWQQWLLVPRALPTYVHLAAALH